MAQDLLSMVASIEAVTTKYKLCRNRVWEAVKSLAPDKRSQLLQIPAAAAARVEQTGGHEGHDHCTFDFCEHSRLDFTGVLQRHEACVERQCATKGFNILLLEKAVEDGMPTAWKLADMSVVEPPQPYMAISHVWSDGTGAGAWPPGQVNWCLYAFFQKIAEQFQCEGIWWDTICIPIGKAARSKAMVNIHRNYEDARITLVHDSFLRSWEWVTAEMACFAIILSPWFSRGWTALELAKSRKVKVIFKGSRGPVIKDLDEDILAKEGASHRHLAASRVIENLRHGEVADLNQLLAVLGSRHTSWPRDVALIAGQLAGITIPSGASQQGIYQGILKRMGRISHGNLFHSSVTMSKGFTWCPTNLFDIRPTSLPANLRVGKNGDVTGKWHVFGIRNRFEERCIWKDAHPLLEARLREALERPEDHLLLVEPLDDLISRALLVEIVMRGGPKGVWFVGPLHFHPPLTRQEAGRMKTGEALKVTIVGTAATEDDDPSKVKPRTGQEGVENSRVSDLLVAAAAGDLETVQALQALGGFDPNIHDERGKTPLHLAAQNGHGGVMGALLASAANPRLKDKYTWTPLHHAAWQCYPLIATMLLRGGADGSIQDRLGQNALHLAAERGNVDIVGSLLSGCANVNAQCCYKQTALHRAVWGGSVKVAELLLAHHLDPNIVDKDGKSALHIAAEKGHTFLVGLLLSHGTALEAPDSMERTPLHLAAQNGHEDVVGLLLSGAQLALEDRNGLTALLLAARSGHRGVVEKLLTSGAHFESRGGSGKTPLMWAAEMGHEEVVKLLLKAGADPRAVGSANQTPLISAAENGHTEVVGLLLNSGSAFDIQDGGGQTPLLWAAEKGHASTVEMLLRARADPETRDTNRQTPLLAAVKNGHATVVEHLLAKNVNLEAQDEKDQTPLSWAARTGNEGIARLLLDRGAKIGSKDSDGYTALDTAAAYSHEPIVRLLLERGARLRPDLGSRTLQWAARDGHAVTVGLLLDSGVEIESEGYNGKTALLAAADREQDVVVKLLLDRGANVRARSKDGQTALSLAFHSESEAVLRVFLGNPRTKLDSSTQGGEMLLWALKHGHEIVARLALKKGARPDAVDRDGRTPLSWAVEKGLVRVVKILLRRRVDLENRETVTRFTPLVYAARHEDTTVMELLLKAGAQVVYEDKSQCTALQAAISLNRPAAAELLLVNGAKIPGDVSAISGWVLDWAARNGFWSVVKRLLEVGVDVDYRGGSSRTALSFAAEAGEEELVRLLLDSNANIEAKDSDGQTPLFYAVGHIGVVRLLLARGANPNTRDKYGRPPLSRAEARGSKDVIKLLRGTERGSLTIALDRPHSLES